MTTFDINVKNSKIDMKNQGKEIATGRVNIRIHRDVTGEIWFGVG
jgi:ribosomal protein L9